MLRGLRSAYCQSGLAATSFLSGNRPLGSFLPSRRGWSCAEALRASQEQDGAAVCLEPPDTDSRVAPGRQRARVPGRPVRGGAGRGLWRGRGEALASILSFLFLFGFLLDFLNQLLIIFLEQQQGEKLALHQLHAVRRPTGILGHQFALGSNGVKPEICC